ncbi:hypothetical protein L1049_027567 [Liquidambar formosana]|uniref:C2 domain-containing protein n=1 Tax=Liquidambar formosana TaxID=63359 RepID=A0AAP0RHJ5_LIQFO
MTTSSPHQPPSQPKTVRKLIVEVIDARDLLPKDGQGSSSPYVIADFDGQKRRTSTKFRDLNPSWNEQLEFIVSDPGSMEFEELEIEVYNDKRMGNASASARKNHFLGRVKLYGSQFAKRGNEGLVYFTLEKKSVFSWIRGEIGLRIYYYDELVEPEIKEVEAEKKEDVVVPPPPPTVVADRLRPSALVVEEDRVSEVPGRMECVHEGSHSPPVVVVEESPAADSHVAE